jgi:histidine ammonia-lyase
MTAAITLTPGHATLADWRPVADGAAVQLDPAAMPAVEAGARAVEAIIAKGAPVYGINTGLGLPHSLWWLRALLSRNTRKTQRVVASSLLERYAPQNYRTEPDLACVINALDKVRGSYRHRE